MKAIVAFDLLRSIGLPDGVYAVLGSGPLLIRRIIDDTPYLDVIARGAAWDHATSRGEIRPPTRTRSIGSQWFWGAVTVGTRRPAETYRSMS